MLKLRNFNYKASFRYFYIFYTTVHIKCLKINFRGFLGDNMGRNSKRRKKIKKEKKKVKIMLKEKNFKISLNQQIGRIIAGNKIIRSPRFI